MNRKNQKIVVILLIFFMLSPIRADEGMWIPLLLEQTRYLRMKELGLRLTPEDIYSINNSSLKDAIVHFGGCTGVVVSDQGLLFTNHHCGYGQIQAHSSLENDYLTDGFWARTMRDELPNTGTTATFLLRMEDVTEIVLKNIAPQMNEQQRTDSINAAIARIRRANLPEGSYRVDVRPLFRGNQYFMYVYEIFTDVRLVGAPPSSIGKFGGDTDNWMWPRHTGDFAIFRIYAGKDNRPASYSPDNVPYRPRRHVQVTTDGVKPGEFTMIYGYPGTTNQYISSHELDFFVNNEFPARIAMRTQRLEIMDNYMLNDRAIAIQYATKQSSVSNAWKRWQGVIRGIGRADGLKSKQDNEEKFLRNLQTNPQWVREYGELLNQIRRTTEELTPLNMVLAYYPETVSAIELVGFAGMLDAMLSISSIADLSEGAIERFLETAATFYRNYHLPLDRDMFVAMMKAYYDHVPSAYHFNEMNVKLSKHKGSFERWANECYSKSVFRSYKTLHDALTNRSKKNIKTIENDPFLAIFRSGREMLDSKVRTPQFRRLTQQADSLGRIYMAAMMLTEQERIFYPDANSTMRVGFGTMEGYSPADAVQFLPYTTLEGIMEKDNPEIYHFRVPQALKDAYHKGDFDRYALHDKKTVPVCFIASNHTSGGNSGSPVLNSKGELLGLNFDRVWEGTMSDFVYDINQCRNITVDVRYILFVTDKVYEATWIIDELNLKCDCED